jgi:hypothetical protein
LSRLDEQTKRRHQNSRLLDRLLREIPGITPQKMDERCTRNGQYAYIFHVNKKQFAGISTERFIEAMNAEGIPNQASYPPLHKLHMFRNGKYRKRLFGAQAKGKHAFLKAKFPATHKAAWETVWIPQPALLGDEEDMQRNRGGPGQDSEERKRTCLRSGRQVPEDFLTMFERFSYRGWNNAYKLSNGVVELIVTADVGPRIVFYGFRAAGRICCMKSRKMRGRLAVPSSASMVATACGFPRRWREPTILITLR